MAPKTKPKRRHAHLHRWARIDRAAAAQHVRIELGAACDLLEVDADFGLHLLQQGYTIREKSRQSMTSYMSLLIAHRAIELLDAISVLVKAGCVAPAQPVFRSMLEAVMYSRYLTVVNDERVAAAHLVAQTLSSQARLEGHVAKHASGSKPTIIGRTRRKVLDSMLAEDRLLGEAGRELVALNQGSSVPVPWYQAFGGPRTLGALSRRLNDETLQGLFDDHYDVASAAAHSANTADSLTVIGDDPANAAELFEPMRMPKPSDLTNLVRATHTLFVKMLLHHIDYFKESPDGLADYRALEERLRKGMDEKGDASEASS